MSTLHTIEESIRGPVSTTPDRSAETTEAGIPWLAFHELRHATRDRWPSIWDLRINADPFADLVRHGVQPHSVLDVGATSRVWEGPLKAQWPELEYRSLDIDRTNEHDYYDFAEVDRQFDVVTCTEVLEHVSPETALQLLRDCERACRPGGFVLVSVPNIYTPGTQLEFTHRTAYQLMDLGGLMSWVGLEIVDASRMCLRGARSRFIHQYLLGPLHRAMRVDFCQSIAVLGRKQSA